MKIVYLDDNFKYDSCGQVIALGFFDGFHKAHTEVLRKTIEVAKENNLKSTLLTFTQSIYSFIKNEKFKYLTSLDDKINYAKKMGFDEVVFIEPNDKLINLSKDEFYDSYLKDAEYLVSGFDYSFGKNREGDISYLKEKKTDKIIVLDEMAYNNKKIGSFEIKEALSLGDLKTANGMLGRDYSIKGILYKRNTKLAMSSQDYYLPKSGEYKIKIEKENSSLILIAKVKQLEDKSGIIIKPLDDTKIEFEKRKTYTLSFLSE